MVMGSVIEKAKSEQRVFLTEPESKEILKKAGLDVTETRVAKSKEEAIALSQEIGFPVVMKIVSADIIHKSDSGGVKLGLETVEQVGNAYENIMSSISHDYPHAILQGVSVQKQARPGLEVIIGMTKDPQFGPAMMFGLGGVWVEILKDVSFRIVPLTEQDAAEMVSEIKGYRLLKGYRGQEAVDVATLEDWLLKLSRFVEQTPDIKEIDLNPIFAYSDGAVAVDARIILESSDA